MCTLADKKIHHEKKYEQIAIKFYGGSKVVQWITD